MPITKLRPSFTFTEDRLAQLKAVVPEAFADGKINWDVLREALGEHLEEEGTEHFGLFWPGKRAARRLAGLPSKGTLVPVPGEGVNEESTRNIFIEGENLEVLKLLLKSYAGRVKMIYIDPPYNTGNDFIYSDDYSEPLEAYLRRLGGMSEASELLTSNPRASGRFHSNWLNMMYPRLLLARQLLRDDGVIFVSIDDHEVHNLRTLMNEILGEDNFVDCIVWVSNLKGRQITGAGPVGTHEYLLCFARNVAAIDQFRADTAVLKKLMPDIYRSPDYEVKHDESGPYVTKNELYNTNSAFNEVTAPTMVFNIHHSFSTGETRVTDVEDPTTYEGFVVARPHPNARQGVRYHAWRWSREKVLRDSSELEFRLINGELRIYTKVRDIRSMAVKDIVLGLSTETGQADLEELGLGRVFDTPKPVALIKLLASASKTEDSIVMDFFAGSCSTAHAVLELNHEDGGNRQFVMVQLAEATPNGSAAHEAGFETIAEIGKERLRRAIRKLQSDAAGQEESGHSGPDWGFRVYALGRSHFREWQPYEGGSVGEYQMRLSEAARSPLVDGWKREDVLVEIMLQEGFPLDSKVKEETEFRPCVVHSVRSEARAFALWVCLDDRIGEDAAARLSKLPKEDIFVCLDSALTDELKMRLSDAINLHVI